MVAGTLPRVRIPIAHNEPTPSRRYSICCGLGSLSTINITHITYMSDATMNNENEVGPCQRCDAGVNIQERNCRNYDKVMPQS
jgi:hypothetical protein